MRRLHPHNHRERFQLWQNRTKNLFALWGHTCCLCGSPIEQRHHIEHYFPIRWGGPEFFWNLGVAHPFCNSSKGNKTINPFTDPNRWLSQAQGTDEQKKLREDCWDRRCAWWLFVHVPEQYHEEQHKRAERFARRWEYETKANKGHKYKEERLAALADAVYGP